MIDRPGTILRVILMTGALGAVAACSGNGLDWDLRGTEASTTDAARQATIDRPEPDSRGVITYPGYQVVVARRGERVEGVARRLGLDPDELARFNALPVETELRRGEVLALPRRVDPAGPGASAQDGPGSGPGGIDVSSIASGAIDRADGESSASEAPEPDGTEPIRHQVVRGETAFSIARLYNVSTRALADWNGLDSDMSVREGQVLLIPVPESQTRADAAQPPAAPPAEAPGAGSVTPEPPSAAQPLPVDDPATQPAAQTPPSPDLGEERSAPEPQDDGTAEETGARLAFPVQGNIIREYSPGSNEGIAISSGAGTPVRAAADGTVAAITEDTNQMPILVIRHADNLLTVYANIDNIQVERGTQVSRGDTIATVRDGDPSFVHFEVRQGFESVDPMDYLQ